VFKFEATTIQVNLVALILLLITLIISGLLIHRFILYWRYPSKNRGVRPFLIIVLLAGILGLLTSQLTYVLNTTISPPVLNPPNQPSYLEVANTQTSTRPDGTQITTSQFYFGGAGGGGGEINGGQLQITSPTELNIADSDIVELSVIPSQALSTYLPRTILEGQSKPFNFIADVQLYPAMEARLTAAGFDFSPTEPVSRSLLADSPTNWKWTIKPKGAGHHKISIIVTIPSDSNGKPNPPNTYRTPLPDITISVTQSSWQSVSMLLVSPFAGILGGLAVIIAALISRRGKENMVSPKI